MKTPYIIAGLAVLAAIVAIIYVLSQPRGPQYVTPGYAGGGGGAANTFAGIWQGLGTAGVSIAGAAQT